MRSLFRIGERVKFRIGTERRAYLLLLGINKDGRVTVLFPGSQAAERDPQAPRSSGGQETTTAVASTWSQKPLNSRKHLILH